MEERNNTTGQRNLSRLFIIAWVLGCLFYFVEYVARSAPAVMLKELAENFNVDSLRLSAILGTYYYTYAITSLIAGIALDRFGGKFAIAAGCLILALGCFIFSISDAFTGDIGRLLQGMGSAFAFTGCVYLASHGFKAKYLATAIGFTQCMGMLGGSAGQFVIAPMIQAGLTIKDFWIYSGVIATVICVLLYIITPRESIIRDAGGVKGIFAPYRIVFKNPQSYLTGIISGLLFAPTTIFAMTWGVAFFQQDRALNYHQAVLTCAMVPMGWVIGCPLLGWISDKIGRRKPVLELAVVVMFCAYCQLLFLPQLMPVMITMLIFGTASGAAMIPYSVIKEANPDEVKGSATGAQNFITFSITAMIGPIFAKLFGKTLGVSQDPEAHFQQAGILFLITLILAFFGALLLKETGSAVKNKKPA